MRNKHQVTETYDVDEHYRMMKWMIGCLVAMVCFWILAWCMDWQTALVCMVANGYFLWAIYFWFRGFPPRKD